MGKPLYTRQMVWVCRCGQCRFGVLQKNALGEDIVICENPDPPWLEPISIMPDWYCADGEWRDDGAVD